MKTKYRFLFVLTLMFSLVTSAWAEKTWDCGNTKVTLSDDGVFTVTAVEGTDGKMADYVSAGQHPWANSRGNVRSIVVSDGVTSIGSYAFASFYGVKSVSIGNDVKSIVLPAFGGCCGCVPPEILSKMMYEACYQVMNPPKELDWEYATRWKPEQW